MPDILVRNVQPAMIEALKERASKNRRSLQQEVLSILEASAAQMTARDPAEVAAAIRARLAKNGRRFEDCVPLIREDRER